MIFTFYKTVKIHLLELNDIQGRSHLRESWILSKYLASGIRFIADKKWTKRKQQDKFIGNLPLSCQTILSPEYRNKSYSTNFAFVYIVFLLPYFSRMKSLLVSDDGDVCVLLNQEMLFNGQTLIWCVTFKTMCGW